MLAGSLSLAAVVSGCTKGSSGSFPGGATIAPSTSGMPTPTTPASGPHDFSGVWEISGSDPTQGLYTGTATIAATGTTYTVERLVTFQTKLPSGRSLQAAWNAAATPLPAGLHVQATLRHAHMIQRLGSQTRAATDRLPVVVDAMLLAPGGAFGAVPSGTTISGALGALSETWVKSGGQGIPAFPVKDETLVALHGPPSQTVRSSMFTLFAPYQGLPAIAPYVSRPEFQAAIHYATVDHTARDFYQAGTTAVVVLDGVVDDFSIAEETWRADAFSHRLHEKAEGFDADMEQNHVDANGMIAGISGTAPPYARQTSGDGALHLGCWVASQVYRFQVTGDAQALQDVENGTRALVTLVDISPDKTQFARAIQDAATAPSSWTRGTGAYASVAWLPGGNNDMLHGIDYGFLAAEQVLPPGHALRAQIGAQARSLLDNVSIAQSGLHEIFLASVAWKTTGDPALQARYKSALGGNLKDRLWTQAGSGIMNVQGIADWSGQHLGAVTFCCLRILGGASPDPDEQGWRQVGQAGALAAYHDNGVGRMALLSAIAAAWNASGAADMTRDVLAEIPFPKPFGDATVERSVSDDYCVSPYPSDPWKGDWMSNPGRVQALTGLPLFYCGTDENYWSRGPLNTGSSVNGVVPTSQDYLHAYWLGRAIGALSATD